MGRLLDALPAGSRIADPRDAEAWAQAYDGASGEAGRRMGRTKKTDRMDARGLAVLLRNGTLPEVWIPPAEIRDRREPTRLPEHTRATVEQMLRVMGCVEREMEIAEKRTAVMLKQDEAVKLLGTLPGPILRRGAGAGDRGRAPVRYGRSSGRLREADAGGAFQRRTHAHEASGTDRESNAETGVCGSGAKESGQEQKHLENRAPRGRTTLAVVLRGSMHPENS